MILGKIKTDEESLLNPQLNFERINENIISNEITIDKFIRKSENNYKMKKNNVTTVNLTGEDESGIEDEIIKIDEEKIINDNNNIPSPKVIKKVLINSEYRKIKAINIQNIKKRKNLKIDKINNIFEQEEKDNIIEKTLHYQNISFISKLINFLNDELNLLFLFIIYIIINIFFSNKTIVEQRLIMKFKISISKNIILFLIFGIITFFSESIFNIVLRREINYIKGILFKIFYFNERKNLKNIDDELNGKKEKKRVQNIIKIKITNNNYIIIILIKLIIIFFSFLEQKVI